MYTLCHGQCVFWWTFTKKKNKKNPVNIIRTCSFLSLLQAVFTFLDHDPIFQSFHFMCCAMVIVLLCELVDLQRHKCFYLSWTGTQGYTNHLWAFWSPIHFLNKFSRPNCKRDPWVNTHFTDHKICEPSSHVIFNWK